MPSAWSATGAGAAEGLETLLKRFREEELLKQRQRQLDEDVRSNKAREGLQARTADDNAAYRRMVEEDRRTAQQDALQGKRDTGATLGTKSLSVDQTISAPQYDAKYKGTVQEPNFQQQLPPETVGLAGTGFGGDKSAPRVADFRFRGTDEQREKIRDDAAVAAAIKDETLPEGVRGYLKVRGLFDKGAAPPAGLFTEQKEGSGELRETDRGFVRVGKDNAVTPITDAKGQAVRGFHPPQQPILVQTDSGYRLRSDVAKDVKDGKPVMPPATAQQRTRADQAKRVASHIEDIEREADEVNALGLMGPVGGRWADFLAGKVGAAELAAGSPENAQLLNEFRDDVGFLKSGMAMVHGGARGGGSVQMMARMDALLSSKTMDINGFKGALKSFKKWLTNYADLNPTSGGAVDEKQESPSALPPGVTVRKIK